MYTNIHTFVLHSVSALSESVAGQQVPREADRPLGVGNYACLAVEERKRRRSLISLERVSGRLKHLMCQSRLSEGHSGVKCAVVELCSRS